MITAVDTNVLLDVFTADPLHGTASLKALKTYSRIGRLVICEIVMSELSCYFERLEDLKATLDRLPIAVEPFGEEVCFMAGQIFLLYRKKGGKRDRILPDFMIGAHAQVRCMQLLTRDRGFYRDYFPDLVITDPATA